MFDIELLRRRLIEKTGYETVLRDEKVLDFATQDKEPVLHIGHTAIRLQDPHEFWADGYQERQNPQMLITTIEFICLHSELHTVRTRVYKAYSNFDPVPDDTSFSYLTLISARLTARSGTRVWWLEDIGMIFPRILR